MSARAYRDAVERTLLGMAWKDHPDGDPADPIEPSPRLRLPAAEDWAAVADVLLDGPDARGADRIEALLLAEVRRIEAARVGPPGGALRASGSRSSEAFRALAAEIALRRGASVTRLAATGPDTAARYRSLHGIPVEGAPGCTLDVRLEPTTDGVLMGIVERRGAADPSAVEILLLPQLPGAEVRTLHLGADESSLVFYEDEDPGPGARIWAYRLADES